MRKFFGNCEDFDDQRTVLLNILRPHMQPNLVPPMVFGFYTSVLQLLYKFRAIIDANLDVHVGVGDFFAWIKPSKVVASRAESNMVLVVSHAGVALRSRDERTNRFH